MIGMQYKIMLPNDYDMEIIKNRVKTNGSKTDGFEGLLFKAYLVVNSPTKKQYAPLYIWKNSEGMNRFIFDGFYKNILNSFGWQTINIGVSSYIDLSDQFDKSQFVLEIEHEIKETQNIATPELTFSDEPSLGKVIIYNPDKWKYTEFYFYEENPVEKSERGSIYEIVHLSL